MREKGLLLIAGLAVDAVLWAATYAAIATIVAWGSP